MFVLLARKSLLIMINNIVGGILGYVILFLIARRLIDPTYTYGVVAFALGFLGLFMFINNPGTNSAHIKRVSEGKDVGVCIGTYLAIKSVLMAIFILVVVSGLLLWKNVFQKGFESPEHEIVIYMLLFNFFLSSFNGVMITTFEAKKEIAKVQFGMFLSTLARLATVMIVIHYQLGVYGLALTWNISILVYFLTSLVMFKGYVIKKPSWTLAKSYMKFAGPVLFLTLAGTLAITTDRVMIQLFWNSEEVGVYFAAYRIMIFLALFSVAVRKLIFPTMSELHAKNKLGHIQDLTWKAEKYIAMFIIPIAFFIALFPYDIIHIMLSDDFMSAAPILRIFALYSIVHALNVPYGSQMLGMGRPVLAAALGIPRCVLNIILNFIFITPSVFGITLLGLGGMGAAIGTLISLSIYFIVTRYVVYRYVSGTRSNWRILFNILSGALMCVPLYFLHNYYPILRFYHVFLYAFIGSSIYFTSLFVFGQFTTKELKYLLNVINPKKMILYLRKEIGN